MSAFYSIRYPDKIELVTDGAWLTPDGVLTAVNRKVVKLPRHQIVLAGRSTVSEHVLGVMGKLMHLSDNEGAELSTHEFLEWVQFFFGKLADLGQFDAEFLIAAWSEDIGPVHFFVACHGRTEGVVPFDMMDPGRECMAGPHVSVDDLLAAGLTEYDHMSPSFAEKHGATVMGIMRERKGRLPGDDTERFWTGGLCDLTTVTADSISIRTLCTFDDEVGKAIDPAH